jgi:transcriptional regulator with XRE-family HTH domain
MNRIKEVLEEKGIKQTWLAEQLGKSYNMVNGYVQNRQQPRLEVLYEIAGNVIMPRVHKDKILQLSRSKEMAEVFTPSWICNAQNNLVDNSWFGKDGVFNKEIFVEEWN